ncbi:MAG: phenylpropionate dioxygenase [Proteobacteria bacterium]|nr:phenylpropionate dioxygenase [Pseudomonadota bacterium]
MNATPTRQDLIDFVINEAFLLDQHRYEEWNALFTDDAFYWVPLAQDQPDGINQTSHMYEDKLLRNIRIERLRSPRAFSQQPPSRCHHLLQVPVVQTFEPAQNHYVVRTPFHYTELQMDDQNMFVGTAFHQLCTVDGAIRMKLKRVNLLNSDCALPSIQLFI